MTPSRPDPSEGIRWGARLLRQALPSTRPDVDYVSLSRTMAVTALSGFDQTLPLHEALDRLTELDYREVQL